jgi:uncharacterized repeat protein (TIGR02543 family)
VALNPAPAGTTYDLTVAVDPSASGTTTPSVGVHSYAEGSVVDITATPADGYAFDEWSGDCSGSGACQVTMDADKSVTAHFSQITHDLTVAVDPVGGGTTTPSVGVHSYAEGSVVDITATPADGYAFDEWSGDCSGSGACQVTMDADKSVTAHFSQITHDLTVAVDPVGGGTTTPSVGVHSYAEGSVVDITATPADGYAFDEWSSDCSGSGACQVTMDADKSVTAHFGEAPPSALAYVGDIGSATSNASSGTLVINTTADVAAGHGIIIAFATYGDPDYAVSVSDDAGNSYEQAATATTYEHGRTYIFAAYNVNPLTAGSNITITHTAVEGGTAAVASVFSGLASVDPLDQSLGNPVAGAQQTASGTTPTVGPTGTTAQADELLIGSIGTEGPPTDAAGTWDYGFTAGQRVGSSGAPNADWTVSMGWRIVSAVGQYTAQKTGITNTYWAAAIATFRGGVPAATHDLTVAVDPIGGGTTTPAAGVHTYVEGSVVDITATPADGYVFDEWSGDCSGSGACQVTMDGDKSVTAHFSQITHNLAVAVDPIGGGTTTPSAGVHSYAEGSVVDITATPAPGYILSHWSGDCSGSGACQVTMDGDKSVTAHFGQSPYAMYIPFLGRDW